MQAGPQVVGLWQLFCDPRWDFLFDREDAGGNRVSRQDLIVNLRDWADEDEVTSALVASFPGPACMISAPPNPFEQGFGDEDYPYDRGEDRYRAKNARLDSLEELYLLAGVSDVFMAAFGDRLTVYLGADAKMTIDPKSPASLLENAMTIADPPGQPILYDPEFASLLQRAALEQSMGGFLAVSGTQFVQLVKALGVTVSAAADDPASPQNFLGDRSSVFRIRATGAVGDVEAKVDAVVTYDSSQTRGGPQAGKNPGRLIRWREE
jgi:general secretion pathway protein K